MDKVTFVENRVIGDADFAAGTIGSGVIYSVPWYIFNDDESYLVRSQNSCMVVNARVDYLTVYDDAPRHTETTLSIRFNGGTFEADGKSTLSFTGGPVGPQNSLS